MLDKPIKIQCTLCDREFAPKGIFNHLIRIHGSDEQKSVYKVCNDPYNTKGMIAYRERILLYSRSPSKCKQCSKDMLYKDRHKSFCNNSCSATFWNLRRLPTAKKTGPTKQLELAKPQYSTLYKCTCKYCGLIWRDRFNVRFCKDHKDKYSHSGRAQFWFTFSISSYPDLFDGILLKQHGMRSKDNPYGVTRDHRVSVQEAILNNYDPYYIKHPLNCELMLFKDNANKHTKSSIDYSELVRLVNTYENNKNGSP